VVPLTLVIMTIAGRSDDIAAKVKSLSVLTVPPPPEWVSNIPLAGRKLSDRWQQYAVLSHEELASQITPYAQSALRWFVSQAGSVATVLLQFLLTVIFTAIMYLRGEQGAAAVLRFARRLDGAQGEGIAVLAAKACRGVALGIVVTAIVQTAIGGIGLAVTGVPAASLLTAVMFMLCLAQLGPFLVMVPSVIWLYWSGQPIWGTVLLVVSILAGTIDNFIKPLLIRKGVDLPLLLILAGVIGGLIAFGIIGLFIGPVLLAVTLTLFQAWVHGTGTEESSSPAGE
jgi:predicted PurR-regulated permease PerM